jgi:hypothetical protein
VRRPRRRRGVPDRRRAGVVMADLQALRTLDDVRDFIREGYRATRRSPRTKALIIPSILASPRADP